MIDTMSLAGVRYATLSSLSVDGRVSALTQARLQCADAQLLPAAHPAPCRQFFLPGFAELHAGPVDRGARADAAAIEADPVAFRKPIIYQQSLKFMAVAIHDYFYPRWVSE
jgi:hypothetical protein